MRHFLEVAYKGTHYSGFQVQHNARTIQGEIESAFRICFRRSIALTGSSRTDAGVHAQQNFFHFDWEGEFDQKWLYNLNAVLPLDIVIKNVIKVADDAHCRFDAGSRTYHYRIHQYKNPFVADRSYFYPYTLNVEMMNEAAKAVCRCADFTSFSKRNTQVKTFICSILNSHWEKKGDQLIYVVTANRFLRGMVRALTATMLRVGRGQLSVAEFDAIVEAKNSSRAFFDTPGHGLTLVQVAF